MVGLVSAPKKLKARKLKNSKASGQPFDKKVKKNGLKMAKTQGFAKI